MTVFVECSRCRERGTPRLHNVQPFNQAMQAGSYQEYRLPDGWTAYETIAHRFTVCKYCKTVIDEAIEEAMTKRPTP